MNQYYLPIFLRRFPCKKLLQRHQLLKDSRELPHETALTRLVVSARGTPQTPGWKALEGPGRRGESEKIRMESTEKLDGFQTWGVPP